MINNEVLLFLSTIEETPYEQLVHCWNKWSLLTNHKLFCVLVISCVSGRQDAEVTKSLLFILSTALNSESQAIVNRIPQVKFFWHVWTSRPVDNLYTVLIFYSGYEKWITMKKNEKKKFLFLIMEKCEAVDPDVRLKAARVLLYLVQGTLYINNYLKFTYH